MYIIEHEKKIYYPDIATVLPKLQRIRLLDSRTIRWDWTNLSAVNAEAIRTATPSDSRQVAQKLRAAAWALRGPRRDSLDRLFRLQSSCQTLQTLSLEQNFILEAEDEHPQIEGISISQPRALFSSVGRVR